MASLPLFSPSFMPKDGASFAPAQPATLEATRRPKRDAAPRPGSQPTLWADLPAMRSLFDAMPAPARVSASIPASIPVAPSTVPAPEPSLVSPVERTEAALREAGLAGRFWRGDALSRSPLPSIASGFRMLDEQLPDGGWPSRCLTELLLPQAGVGEIRFLAATLSSLTQAGREVVLLGPPHIPDPTGWEQLGIDMRRVLIVRTPRPADRLWALEQSLKSSAFGALIAWLPEEKTLARNDALRRLQLAAASADGLTFLMRPSAAQYHASPAPLRLTLAVGKPEGSRRTLSVRLLKRRGPVLAKPLTLLLPEIHRGMKTFGCALDETSSLSRSATSLPPLQRSLPPSPPLLQASIEAS
jgi:protein ImuA